MILSFDERLDRYWAVELGCSSEALHAGGLTICCPAHRDAPRWMGWLVPLECIALAGAPPGVGVISVAPTHFQRLAHFLQFPGCNLAHCLPPEGRTLQHFAHENLPNADPKIHNILHCDANYFKPAAPTYPVSLLEPDDIHASWYRLHFDGPIYVARNEADTIVSWAAIKCKSSDVWEMAVVTEAPYRGHGLARSVVSRATQATLEAGKVPIYLHEISNYASARVCTALGYHLYGYELTFERPYTTTPEVKTGVRCQGSGDFGFWIFDFGF